jgi:hypothetical protein
LREKKAGITTTTRRIEFVEKVQLQVPVPNPSSIPSTNYPLFITLRTGINRGYGYRYASFSPFVQPLKGET